MRLRRVEARRLDILAIWEMRKDFSRKELLTALADVGLQVTVAGLYRFFFRRGMTRKKDCSCHRAELTRCLEAASGLARRLARSRAPTPGVFHKHGWPPT